MGALLELLRAHAGKSVSIGVLAGIFAVGMFVVQWGDSHYTLAADTAQVQQTINNHMVTELEDNIFIITMKQNGATEAQIEAALKEKYEKRLEALRRDK